MIWITWENQRRNRELAKALDIKIHELSEIDRIGNRFEKYATGIWKTLVLLANERPKIVFAQNPSIVLSFLLVCLKPFARFTVFIDAHNAGLFPKEGRSWLLGKISRYIQSSADLTIVTNEQLKRHVEGNGGRAFVLQDKIPDIPIRKPSALKGEYNLLFICTYAEDEPYQEVFQAAGKLAQKVCIYVTGNYKKKNISLESAPGNIIVTGFVPEEEYIQLLNSVDATMILTERENCLVCGAYETLAVGKPMILSDTTALREYFRKGAIYTRNNAADICNAVNMLVDNIEKLRIDASCISKELGIEWNNRKIEIENIINKALTA